MSAGTFQDVTGVEMSKMDSKRHIPSQFVMYYHYIIENKIHITIFQYAVNTGILWYIHYIHVSEYITTDSKGIDSLKLPLSNVA